MAAARMGAGGVRCLVPDSIWSTIAAHVVEIMLQCAPETEDGSFSLEALSEVSSFINKCKAGWAGCGLGQHPDTCSFVREALKQIHVPMVLDADALNALDPHFIKEHSKGKWVLTPHEREFERLIGSSLSTSENKASVIQEYAQEWNCVILLKGFPSLIAGPNGEIYKNPTGHTSASTAGCGDVLAGICAGFLGQGLQPLQAAVVGMYLAGMASQFYHEAYGGHTLMASDLLLQIPLVLGKLYAH